MTTMPNATQESTRPALKSQAPGSPNLTAAKKLLTKNSSRSPLTPTSTERENLARNSSNKQNENTPPSESKEWRAWAKREMQRGVKSCGKRIQSPASPLRAVIKAKDKNSTPVNRTTEMMAAKLLFPNENTDDSSTPLSLKSVLPKKKTSNSAVDAAAA